MTSKLSVRDIEARGKRVFCRVDFNVPVDDGRVGDDRRIVAALPTIRWLSEHGARLTLASHLGRPKGTPAAELSLRPVADRLGELLSKTVGFVEDCVGDAVSGAVDSQSDGDVLLLENLRFHAGETENAPEFVERLAAPFEVYVNDAFGTAHRAHASTEGIARRLRPAAAGFLMTNELEQLGKLLRSPQTPYVAILGGAKVSDKIELVRNLLPRVDAFIVGGAMAYTFLAAQGVSVGRSLVESDKLELARDLAAEIDRAGKRLLLPSDHVVETRDGGVATTSGVDIGEDDAGSDIGPTTVEAFGREIAAAATILWNGPVGRFEIDAFASGTEAVGRAIAASEAVSIVGGGDTASAAKKFGVAERMTHVSTGGGASLELLSGRTLPGVAALSDAP